MHVFVSVNESSHTINNSHLFLPILLKISVLKLSEHFVCCNGNHTKMPKNENGNCSVVKRFGSTSDDDPHAGDVCFTNTTIAFSIEENRRRRAELADDVSELINISKCFQRYYAGGYEAAGDASDFPMVRKSLNKKNKIPANGKSMATKPNKMSSCVTANGRGIAGKLTHTKLNNAAGAIKNNNNNAVVMQAEQLHPSDDLPPVFDPEKLNEYCIDLVEEYFKKSHTTDAASDHNIKSKTLSTECMRRPTESKAESMTQQTKIESNKYASVSARYLNKCSTNRRAEEQPTKTMRNSWISARSIAILENANRKGAEVKRHNCIVQETKNVRALGSAKKKLQTQNNRSTENFHRTHPGIDLIPSATIFPRRAIKVHNSCPADTGTSREMNGSYDSIVDMEEMSSSRSHDVDARPRSGDAVAAEPTELNNRAHNSLVINAESHGDEDK